MTQLTLGIAAPQKPKRLSRDEVACSGCKAVYQRPAYSLREKHRDQILVCPCKAETRIPGEGERE